MNFLIVENRTCQITILQDSFISFSIVQDLHLTVLIFSLLIFVLSFFNLASTLQEFSAIYWVTLVCLIFLSALPFYNAVTIIRMPCRSYGSGSGIFLQHLDSGISTGNTSIFQDPVDVLSLIVFCSDIIITIVLLLAARYFYHQK